MKKIFIIIALFFIFFMTLVYVNYENQTTQIKPITQINKTDAIVVMTRNIDYRKYNIAYMDDRIKKILVKKIGIDGRTAFYLPPTGYINVSKGTKYGVAFAINNVNPSPDGNRFTYNFSADDSVKNGCNISMKTAQSFIERGWTSFGKISKGWIDAMTIYFSFPKNLESPCNLKYNFTIKRDGIPYDSKQLEFNLKQ